MKAIWNAVVLITALGLASCASPEPPKVVMREMSPEKLRTMTALEAEIEEITFRRVPIVTALGSLQDADRSWPQEMPKFMFAIDGTNPGAVEGRLRNPKVTLRMRDVTLGAVLDELCRQTGWAKTSRHGGQRVDFFPTGKPEY